MGLRDRVVKLTLVTIFLGATSFLILLIGDMTPSESCSGTKTQKIQALAKKKISIFTQPAIPLTNEEKLVLIDLLSFLERLPKNLAARIGQIEIQSRPPNSELTNIYQHLLNSEEIVSQIAKNGDLLLNIEILSMENTSIFLSSLESLKTKNRIYEFSWQKKTR